jgi:hypothetical protein
MIRIMRIFYPLFLSLICMSGNLASRATATQTAQRCGVNQDQPASKILADFDGHGWHEYQSIQKIPELELNAGSAARLWPGSNGNLLIKIEQPGEDFAIYTDYCFDKAGFLLQIRYELRTAWGWGYREEGRVANGKLKPEISEFFSTQTNQPVKRPEEANDVPEALTPRVYLRQSQLPFFKLLSK